MLCLGDATTRDTSQARKVSAQTAPLLELPSLDGEVSYDAVARRGAADDWGHHVHRSPVAVLTAASVSDVSRIVAYANQRHLKIAMRGQGHSVYGQAQVEKGIVIDSRTLNAIGWHGSDRLDAQPGALWGTVAATALEQSLTPPVMPDALMLSVGGTLSAGGTGATSCGSGAQVDHVLELDVVTGRGDLVTCSPSQDEELFHMVLAGLGQCGIIVRARLRLVHTPAYVAVRTLTYDDPDALVSDGARLARADAIPVLGAEVTKDADGRWRFALLTGVFSDQANDETVAPGWIAGLQFTDKAPVTTMPCWNYLDRRTASITASKVKRAPNPSLAVVLPERSVRSFLADVLSDPGAAAGIWRIEVLPMITARFKQPLHILPEGTLSFTLRLQRRASAENAPDHRAMLSANQMLVHRCIKMGGKIYPPFAPVLSQEDWKRHYGPQTWRRFVAAKRRYDPNNVLTPGAGVFA